MMSSGVTDQEPTVVQPLFREPVNIGEWVELVVVVVLLRPSRRGLVHKRQAGCTYRAAATMVSRISVALLLGLVALPLLAPPLALAAEHALGFRRHGALRRVMKSRMRAAGSW